MRSLSPHHIIDLYCWVDDTLAPMIHRNGRGRPPLITSSELITMLIWNTMVIRQKNLKDLGSLLNKKGRLVPTHTHEARA